MDFGLERLVLILDGFCQLLTPSSRFSLTPKRLQLFPPSDPMAFDAHVAHPSSFPSQFIANVGVVDYEPDLESSGTDRDIQRLLETWVACIGSVVARIRVGPLWRGRRVVSVREGDVAKEMCTIHPWSQ